jgi:hypothetical protein
MTEVTDTSTELDPRTRGLALRINEGSVSLAELLRALEPAPPPPTPPASPPLPIAISPEQRAALDKLTEVFGVVVPTERRMLTPEEIAQVIEERETMDELKDLAEKRTASIRTIICNHLDVEAERDGKADASTPRDAKGHYILTGSVRVPQAERQFKRELRATSPTLDERALLLLAEHGEITHEDYLSMTTQTRVVDENKVMLALKRKPELLDAIAKATRPGSKTASLYLRKNTDA